MNQKKKASNCLERLSLLVLTAALSAASVTTAATVEPPPPSLGQRALIEVHDTAGIGWWSSPSVEIAPAPVAIDASAATSTPAPARYYPKRTFGADANRFE